VRVALFITCIGDTVFVSASTVIATMAVTPAGTGWATSETTVAAKIASRWPWIGLRPGGGQK